MYNVRLRNKLCELSSPLVMGIVNVTPDSFSSCAQSLDPAHILRIVQNHIDQGAQWIDIGACSTRPNAPLCSEQEEWDRLRPALEVIRNQFPDIPLSVDTFRATIARQAATLYAVDIINDISGGDAAMFDTVAEIGLPYILTYNAPQEPISWFEQKIQQLRALHVKDIILDPGFGFAKTLEQNYQLLHNLHTLQIFHLPVLVGVSRKSMIYRLLRLTPQEALNGTTVLHTLALLQGANILRVHDVKEAVQTIQLTQQFLHPTQS